MRAKTILLFCLTVVLSACSQAPISYRSNALEEHLQNPLFAEHYFESLVQRMVELVIREDPILNNEQKKAIADNVRREGLEKAKEATQTQLKGTYGEFMVASEWAKGDALYVHDTLYFGPNFQVDPGPSLHVFLTTVVDPRLESFPDSSALDLGQIQSMIADQSYPVPNAENPLLYRTVVLFDTVLERIYAFAQLSPF
ncbi:hypothetical protein HYZ98_04740 [Candidatus Peregrinibacteria bacterium]|nr:hypothetical protein [Candidatus Peregrinibacteria bacterium]